MIKQVLLGILSKQGKPQQEKDVVTTQSFKPHPLEASSAAACNTPSPTQFVSCIVKVILPYQGNIFTMYCCLHNRVIEYVWSTCSDHALHCVCSVYTHAQTKHEPSKNSRK